MVRLKKNTTVCISGDIGLVILYDTHIVSWDENFIALNTGGYFTRTIKMRMNQVSEEFRLGFRVFQEDYYWYAYFKEKKYKFNGYCLTLERGK